jgi:hypothetical protein
MPENKYKIEVLNDAFRAITQRLGIRDAITLSQDDLQLAIESRDPYVATLYKEYSNVFMEYATNPVPETQLKKDDIGSKIIHHLESKQN